MVTALVEAYGAAAVAQVLDAFKDLGFHYATQAGITISKNDIVSPPNKEEILDRYEEQATEIQGQYEEGYITAEERHEAVTERWDKATEEVAQAMEDNLHELNPIFMMANSGARGSFKQIRQLAGMRGLMANPKGEIIERPIKANFMEGLVGARVLHLHARRPQGPRRHGAADRRLRLPDAAPGRCRPGRDRSRRGLQDQGVHRDAAPRRGRQPEPEPDRAHRGEEVRHQARPRALEARPGDRPARAGGRSPRPTRTRR